MKYINKIVFILLLLFTVQMVAPTVMQAQCPMCRMSAEKDLVNGGGTSRGLNKGILYLLSVPYLMIGTIGYLFWRNRRIIAQEEQEDELRDLLGDYDISLSSES